MMCESWIWKNPRNQTNEIVGNDVRKLDLEKSEVNQTNEIVGNDVRKLDLEKSEVNQTNG
jgi:hypothetical protein